MAVRVLVCCLLLGAWVPAAAQDPPPAVPATGSITGVVLDGKGGVVRSIAVRVRPAGGGNVRINATDGSGRYTIASLSPGTYVVDVLGEGQSPSATTVAVAAAPLSHDIVSYARPRGIWGLPLVSILAYVFALLAFRHHNIVRTNRELLCAQLENIATRIPLEADPARQGASDELKTRVWDIWKAVNADLTWREWFFWSRGREIGAWTRLHEIERQLVAFLVPDARVVERAVSAEADLRKMATPSALALADRLRVTLQPFITVGSTPCTPDPCLLQHLKQQLAEALSLLYGENDTRFAALMEWHNKAMWMVYLALLVILAVGLVFQHEELFLIGAAGGLMSRMARALFREDVPSDYGASWTTLFLSPLLGAISAWFGVALIMWLTTMQVLGEAVFGLISWDGDIDATLIATGFVLGFSERLFTSLLSAVEGKVTTGLQGSKPAAPVLPSPLVIGAGGTLLQNVVPGVATPPAETRDERILRELDLRPGERGGFVGDVSSTARSAMVSAVGAEAVVDVSLATLSANGPFDGVLIEAPATAQEMTSLAGAVAAVMRPNGRVVVVGRTPASAFEADATSQRNQNVAGPALVKEVLVLAGLTAQEPPVRLGEGDPVEWLAGFEQSAASGTDR